MKYEIGPTMTLVVKEILEQMGLDDNHDNRVKLLAMAFNVGLSQLFFCAGVSARFDEEFPGKTLGSIYSEDEDEPETAPGQQFAPDPCPNCGKTPRHNGREWACNCQTYSVGPKPINPCPHCGSQLRPNHYYWECDCNRYDESPEVTRSDQQPVLPPGWSGPLFNSFPTE